jgi:polysaccharide biosynthesis protein PelG
MAGIGFELRRLLKKESIFGVLEAYGYAGIVSSGPWVLSILGILVIGILSASVVHPSAQITQFQVSVTYLIACSLIFTGFAQLAFTRFISDRLFEKRDDLVVSNLNGVLLVVLAAAGTVGVILMFTLFNGLGTVYRLLMLCAFVLLCGIWIGTILLSGLKRYRSIVGLYFVGYATTVSVALLLRRFGLEGLLFGFAVGHFILFLGTWLILSTYYTPQRAISFEFARKELRYESLMVIGLLYNAAIWADKFMFWFNPDTSDAIIGPLRASVIYDFPVFLAYLSIIPGMAVFLVRIETDFSEYYERFYEAVRGGGSLEVIEDMRNEMVFAVRHGLAEIAKVQTMSVLILFVAAPASLRWLGISDLYLPLLYVHTVGASLQVMLLALLNILFYLDHRRIVLGLCLMFLVLNIVLTGITFIVGPASYGYGYVLSLLFTLGVGIYMIDRKLDLLEYETFMLQ